MYDEKMGDPAFRQRSEQRRSAQSAGGRNPRPGGGGALGKSYSVTIYLLCPHEASSDIVLNSRAPIASHGPFMPDAVPSLILPTVVGSSVATLLHFLPVEISRLFCPLICCCFGPVR